MNTTIPLTEKYRPQKFSEVKGQEIAIDKLKAFINAFNKGISQKNAILLYGPAGTGKTSLAHVISKELNHEIFELNSSDLRNRQKLDEILKPSTQQKSLFSTGKIILVDEVDGVTTSDYGGLAELLNLIEKTKFPIIITCNDVWQNKFSLLRNKCEMMPIKELSYLAVLNYLKEITIKEKRTVNEEVIKEIAAKSRGDLRAALNDLQSIIYMDESEILEKEVYLREKSQDIFNALREIFKTRINKDTLEIYDSVDMEMDNIALWLEENIPTEYRGKELAAAFEALSRADIFKGRIHRQQHWRFMVYQNFFLSAGISAAKGNKNLVERFTKYTPPKRILKIWMINQKNQQKKTISGKFAELTHTGKKRALGDFSIIAMLIDESASKILELTEQEQKYLEEKRREIIHSLGKIAI
jgi:replication factor C large subunit